METLETTLGKIKAEMKEARRDWKNSRRQLRLAKLEETFFRARYLALNDCLMAFDFAELAPISELPIYTGQGDWKAACDVLREINRRGAEFEIKKANPLLGDHFWNKLWPYRDGMQQCRHCGLIVERPEYIWGCPGVVPADVRAKTATTPPPLDMPVSFPRGHDWHRPNSSTAYKCTRCGKVSAAFIVEECTPAPEPAADVPEKPAAVNTCGHTWRDAHDNGLPIRLCMLCGAKQLKTLDECATTPTPLDLSIPRGTTFSTPVGEDAAGLVEKLKADPCYRPPIGQHSWNLDRILAGVRRYTCLRCRDVAYRAAELEGEPDAEGCTWKAYA